MSFIKSANGTEEINIYYEEYGTGKPVILIHGWPLDHQMWEYQIAALVNSGHKVIAYDRRGFGKSDKPWSNNNYEAYADDLKALIDQLNLVDVSLVGFSMGGGEIARYIAKYGSSKLSKVAFIASIVPYLLQTDDNPDGVPQEAFDGFIEQIREDRPAFLAEFGKGFYGVGFLNKPVSQQILDWTQSLALQATSKATEDCVVAFSSTDFRNDVKSIQIPTLIIHGDADETVPIAPTGQHAAALIPGAEFKIYQGSPHGLFITDKEQLNQDLVAFLG